MTEGMQSELIDTNVKVTLVFPGAVGTEIMKNSGLESRKSSAEDEEKIRMILTPAEAAEIIVNGMEKDKNRVFAGKDSKMLDRLYRLAPEWASGMIAKKMK